MSFTVPLTLCISRDTLAVLLVAPPQRVLKQQNAYRALRVRLLRERFWSRLREQFWSHDSLDWFDGRPALARPPQGHVRLITALIFAGRAPWAPYLPCLE